MLGELLRHHGLECRSPPAPFAQDADEEERGRLELTCRLRTRLRERGIHAMHALRAALHGADVRRDGTCRSQSLEGALASLGIRLKASEFSRLVALFGAGEGLVDYARLLACGRGEWSPQREDAVRAAFEALARASPGGRPHVGALERCFRPEALTQELVPGLLEHQSAQEFLARWGGLGADGLLSWLHFAGYYFDASAYFAADRDFVGYACRSLGVDVEDWLAERVFRRFAGGEALPAEGFVRMLRELDPTVSEEEALAFYRAVDEDGSGEVSLREFLASRVLRVKRLFDEVDTRATRTATREELLLMLRRLDGAITDEEALALYHFADVDGNGEVSFVEFLENNLLRLLRVFGEFCKARNRCLGEAEMKALLRREDPALDDAHVHHVYRAIDTDASGSVSFTEFCQSHILRAKALFDRHDADGSRSLTKLRFRELLLDVDASLTGAQMEALYELVADHGSGKVHLGGFLRPNVVRIKLLFDKYDRDRSGYLDGAELRAMLGELFASATERDVEALVLAVMPPGQDSGIAFTAYVQRFREISQRHDSMQLARRREARARAVSRGLPPAP